MSAPSVAMAPAPTGEMASAKMADSTSGARN
jgi:hypothetical protein